MLRHDNADRGEESSYIILSTIFVVAGRLDSSLIGNYESPTARYIYCRRKERAAACRQLPLAA